MVLIIGGAYQGMLEYALEKTHYRSTDVYNCTRDKVDIDFSKRILPIGILVSTEASSFFVFLLLSIRNYAGNQVA